MQIQMIPNQNIEQRAKDKILEYMQKHNGYITSKEVDKLNLHRQWLSYLEKEKKIERIGRGVYINSNAWPDPYYALNLQLPKIVFSHMTALYFHNLSIKSPDDEWDITVTRNYHSFRLKQPYNIFYVEPATYGLGLTKIQTNFGNFINVYDAERTICDIIRSRERMDYEYVKYGVREYLRSSKKNLQKLIEYANKLGIQNKVAYYVELQC